MENSMLSRWPIDPGIVIISLAAVTLLLLILVIVFILQNNKMYRRYDAFMRGKDAESLEQIIMGIIEENREIKSQDRATKETMKAVTRSVKGSFQKFGMVKYNAFKGMGGNLSFALAMLDMNNTGFILNSVHSREGCYLYIKDVVNGEAEITLGNEEREALERALGY